MYQQTILCQKTEKPTIFIPCPTEHPTIVHPTESDYLQTMLNEILLDYLLEYKNKIVINPIFNDAQFNPYSVENIPPRIENVNIKSDVKYSWEEIKVSVDVVSSIWSIFNWIVKTITQIVTQKVEIVEHSWAVVSCDIYDVGKITYATIKVIDTGKSKTFYPQTTSAHLEATLDIDYMKDYLWKYDVEIKARDSVYNMITIKQEIGSKFYGFVTAVASLVAGAISAAVDFAVKMVNAIVEWIINMIKAMMDAVVEPIKRAIEGWKTKLRIAVEEAFTELQKINPSEETHQLKAVEILLAEIMGPTFLLLIGTFTVLSYLETLGKVQPVLIPFVAIICSVLVGILAGTLGILLAPQAKPFITEKDNIESIPELGVDKIPSDKWWSVRAPIIVAALLGILMRVILESLVAKGLVIGNLLTYGMIISFAGALIFTLGGVGIVPGLFATIAGWALTAEGFVISVIGALQELAKGLIFTPVIGAAFTTLILGVATANLLYYA